MRSTKIHAFLLLMAVFFTAPAFAEEPASVEEIFGKRPSAASQAWIDDAVKTYNLTMTALQRDWLPKILSARTDTGKHKVTFVTTEGRVIFDVKSIGTFKR